MARNTSLRSLDSERRLSGCDQSRHSECYITAEWSIQRRCVSCRNTIADSRSQCRQVCALIVDDSTGLPPTILTSLSNANNTYVSAVGASCPAGRAPARCAAESGGQFNDLTSSTVSQLMGVSESGASLEPLYNVNDSFWRKDVVQIDGIYPITDMPIGMLDYGRGAIGLSKNSSILSKLSTAPIIPSRSYALWWGLQGAEQEDQMDGSVVLGGYDRAKTKGKNLTQPLSPSSSQCPSGISVDVTSFRLRSKDGWSADLLGDSKMTSFPTCIDMTLPINTVPSGPWQTLLNITRFQLGQPDLGMYDWWGTELLGNNSYVSYSNLHLCFLESAKTLID